MRRRLWWSLISFDARIMEMADYKSMSLIPTWDCKIPLNVNDFDLLPEMKAPPAVHGNSTEALFAVVRSEISEFIRHSAFHLDFIIPTLKIIAKDVQGGRPIPEGGELVTLERMIEEKYLKSCNPENPLHFMTIWTARGHLAKFRLVESFSMFARSSTPQTDAQRNTALSHALRMLMCDTKLATSPLVKGYAWFTENFFPFPGYLHLIQDLKRRPVGDHVERTWDTLSANYEARSMHMTRMTNPFHKVFAKIILQAWEAREAVSEDSPTPPRVVTIIRQQVTDVTKDAKEAAAEQPSGVMGDDMDDFAMFLPVELGGKNSIYSMGGTGHDMSAMQQVQTVPDMDVDQFDWGAMDWNTIQPTEQ